MQMFVSNMYLIIRTFALLLRRLSTLGHKVIADALSRKPLLPGRTFGGNDPRSSYRNDIHTLHVIRQCDRLWEANGLAPVALEIRMPFPLYRSMYILSGYTMLLTACVYVNGIYDAVDQNQ
jgi:hypothetical protein